MNILNEITGLALGMDRSVEAATAQMFWDFPLLIFLNIVQGHIGSSAVSGPGLGKDVPGLPLGARGLPALAPAGGCYAARHLRGAFLT